MALKTSSELRTSAENNYIILFVFRFFYYVTSSGTYPDMHRRMCLVDEAKYGAILWNYFFPLA
jgi:hypothetical protein